MIRDWGEIWRYRELLYLLVRRDLKVRYKNSVLGFGWSFVNPVLQVLTITLVIQFLMRVRTNSFHAYVLCAMLPWTFFNTAMMDSCASLVTYYNLIRKTYFPREIIQIASVLANLIHFLASLAIFILYMTFNPLFWKLAQGTWLWAIQPTSLVLFLPIAGLALLVFGLSMFLSVWTLYFEDVRFLTDSVLKILYWTVPVVYFAEIILHRNVRGHGDLIYVLYMLNPLACFISVFRKMMLPATNITLGSETIRTAGMTPEDWGFLGIALAVSAAIALLGQRYFAARKWRLAERG
jgi:ABC-type polysaccharide/polyol phosphate export permease